MSDLTHLQQRIADLLTYKMHIAAPPFDADLFDTGCLDSLSFVSLLVCIEEEFGLRIDLRDLDLGRFQSIAAIAAFVSDLTPAPAQQPEAASDGAEALLALRELSLGYAG